MITTLFSLAVTLASITVIIFLTPFVLGILIGVISIFFE